MVNFYKRSQAPASLAAGKSYKEPDTVKALYEDFRNKCYICGSKAPITINVEHFDEHRNDPVKMYDWKNLFYACMHCNLVKQQTFSRGSSNLLNCTDKNQKVDYWIEYRLNYDPNLKKDVDIHQNMLIPVPSYATQIQNTVKLLNNVFNGSGTAVKNTEASNLVESLQTEVNKFLSKLLEYKKENRPLVRAKLQNELISMVAFDSPFAAFKRWIIRDQHMSLEIPFREHDTLKPGLILIGKIN